MESATLRAKILRLIGRYNTLSDLYSGVRKGIYPNNNTLRIRIGNIKKSIHAAKQDIHSYLLGVPILEATYSIDGITYKCRLTNISANDLYFILDEMGKINGSKIEILEVKEIPTYINRV